MRVLAIDNFFDDPNQERADALSASYQLVDHNGLKYPGIAETEDPKSVEKICAALGVEKFREVKSMYRRYLADDEQGTYIHSDVEIADFTVIAFLTAPEDCSGGLAFWTHRMTGWANHPTTEQIAKANLKDSPKLWDRMHSDGVEEEFWEMNDYFPMQFNRALCFWAPRYHSRYPKNQIATELGKSRLIKVFFCKT
jgi:hypothetical protein